MMVIRVKVNVKPETKSDFIDAMKASISISSQFDGCLNFNLYEDITDENALLLYEEWDTPEHFQAYKSSDHFQESGKVLFSLMDGSPDSAYFDAKSVPVQ
mgnify:CR=1 FL=1